MRVIAPIFAFAALYVSSVGGSPAFASEPGQPLDCSDWVFLEPGYSCVLQPCVGETCSGGAYSYAMNNSGEPFTVRIELNGSSQQIGCTDFPRQIGLNRVVFLATKNGAEVVIGYVEGIRCAWPGGVDAAGS